MQAIRSSSSPNIKPGQQFAFRGARMEHFGQRLTENGRKVETDWTFLRGMRVSVKPNVSRVASQGKCFSVTASCKPLSLWLFIDLHHLYKFMGSNLN